MSIPWIDGSPMGRLPLVHSLLKGAFLKKPPSRRFFPSWKASSVFTCFPSWSSPLSSDLVRKKLALLLAMTTARRPAEIASLKCSPSFLQFAGSSARFIPTRLSRTDSQSHLDPPISVSRHEDASLCPFATPEPWVDLRVKLSVSHDFLFCDGKSVPC